MKEKRMNLEEFIKIFYNIDDFKLTNYQKQILNNLSSLPKEYVIIRNMMIFLTIIAQRVKENRLLLI